MFGRREDTLEGKDARLVQGGLEAGDPVEHDVDLFAKQQISRLRRVLQHQEIRVIRGG